MHVNRRHCIGILGAGLCTAANRTVTEQWSEIAKDTDGVVGAAALHLGSGRRISLHGEQHFPLASVCKLPIAINILAMVDEGKCSLADEIEIPREDVVPSVSIVAEQWPKRKRFPLHELLEWMVAKSDNTAVETLFRIGGGSNAMASRFSQWRIQGMRVDRSERQCGLEAAGVKKIPPISQWTPATLEQLTAKIPPRDRRAAMGRFIEDPRDSGTPNGTVDLLRKGFRGEVLSAKQTDFLIRILKATTTGEARIKGLLPAGTVVAHKTGTTSTVLGFNGGTNDAGVIFMPNGGGQLAIAVYVKGSTRDQATRERVIATIAKTAFDSAAALA